MERNNDLKTEVIQIFVTEAFKEKFERKKAELEIEVSDSAFARSLLNKQLSCN